MDQTNVIRNKVRGSLIGGAVGDALGYPIEFMDEAQIAETYGTAGLTRYRPDPYSNAAVISDDTQMTLFTANALLFGMHRQRACGNFGEPRHYALYAYLGWLHTQECSYSKANRIPDDPRGRTSDLLRDVPELYVRRAPGLTCLSGLRRRKETLDCKIHTEDYIVAAINNSKGCGGVMRIAPLGLTLGSWEPERLALEGAQLAAITHSHPLGYMPAAVLTYILQKLVYSDETPDLKELIAQAKTFVDTLFAGDPYLPALTGIIDHAMALSENNDPDVENIGRLGEGWVAEEALAIALYCSLKYKNSFSDAVIASVNHKGDSDSTGAITGNIMGALLGYEAIEQKWRSSLELHDLILKIADELHAASCYRS